MATHRYATGRTYDTKQVIEWVEVENTTRDDRYAMIIFRDTSRHIAGLVRIELSTWTDSIEDMTLQEVGRAVLCAYDAHTYTYVSMNDPRF